MTPELEPRDREVLAVLDTYDGETTTSTLRDHIEWMAQPSQSSYRVNKLDDAAVLNSGP